MGVPHINGWGEHYRVAAPDAENLELSFVIVRISNSVIHETVLVPIKLERGGKQPVVTLDMAVIIDIFVSWVENEVSAITIGIHWNPATVPVVVEVVRVREGGVIAIYAIPPQIDFLNPCGGRGDVDVFFNEW